MSAPVIAALVLAAGSSRRMRRSKLLLPLAGRPLLQHVVDGAANVGFAEIVVVVAPASPLPAAVTLPHFPPSRWLVCEDAASGQAASLACGLGALDAQVAAAAILLGDQPGVDPLVVARVLAAFAAGDRPAARPVYRGGDGEAVPGHPVLLARSLWPRLLGERGDHGARELLRRAPELLLAVPIDAPPPADVDTDEDYRRLRDGE